MKRFSIFLVVVALIAGMVSCEGEGEPEYELIMAVNPAGGGTAIDLSDASPYPGGTCVNIEAEAAVGFEFSHWSASAGGEDMSNRLEMANVLRTSFCLPIYVVAQTVIITANFVPVYDLTIASTDGGAVTIPGEGNFIYEIGTVVNLVAEAEECYGFVNWTGDVDTIADIYADSTTITMDSSKSVNANFALRSYSLTTDSTDGGSVYNPGESTFTYDCGQIVNLVAQAEGDHRFVEWSGDIDTITSAYSAITTISMEDDYTIVANFEEIPTYNLAISSTADGSVTTPGEGTFTYYAGTMISLVATPATCCQFINWTGDTETIANINSASTTITMNDHYTIIANFEFPPEGVPIVCNPPIAPGRQTYVVGTPNNPRITQVVLDPLDVNKCAWQEVTVWARDLSGNPIFQVTGEGRTNSRSFPFTLSLISGTETNGIWQGSWYNEDDYCLRYQVALYATSASGTHVLELTFK